MSQKGLHWQHWNTKQEGKVEEKVEIAKNLISLGLDKGSIAKGTGLTIEQIEVLRKEMK